MEKELAKHAAWINELKEQMRHRIQESLSMFNVG